MITASDKARMDRDVSDVITDWESAVEIWTLAPIDRQTNWNPIMHEVIGTPVYDKQLDVPVEVRDSQYVSLNTTVGGPKYNGDVIICVPHVYKYQNQQTNIVINDDSLIILDGDVSRPWRIKSIKRRLGESLVHISRMVGDEA